LSLILQKKEILPAMLFGDASVIVGILSMLLAATLLGGKNLADVKKLEI